MPVTARLSKQLYHRLGESATNELVDWFNQVDATYKSNLREMNEQSYARFDARLEQRLAEFGAELRTEMRTEMAALRAELMSLETRMDAKFEARLAAATRDQTRFMFTAWAALWVPLIGLWFR